MHAQEVTLKHPGPIQGVPSQALAKDDGFAAGLAGIFVVIDKTLPSQHHQPLNNDLYSLPRGAALGLNFDELELINARDR